MRLIEDGGGSCVGEIQYRIQYSTREQVQSPTTERGTGSESRVEIGDEEGESESECAKQKAAQIACTAVVVLPFHHKAGCKIVDRPDSSEDN